MPACENGPTREAVNTISIRPVEKFAEPLFSHLWRSVFADIQQPSAELAATLATEASSELSSRTFLPAAYRVGAFDGEELVGWSAGWIERGNVFYMANSGVVASHRRRGIYSSLLAAVRQYAVSNNLATLRSQHSAINNPVIIAKLRAGFHISGLSQSAQMGSLVEMTLHLSEERYALFRKRVLPYVTPDA
jgi:ribosomal protein S18 acetylase RimI-like enzyme